MVTTIVIYDAAPSRVRTRIAHFLREAGFRQVFQNVSIARGSRSTRERLVRRLRRALVREHHRILVLTITEHQYDTAGWVVGPARKEE